MVIRFNRIWLWCRLFFITLIAGSASAAAQTLAPYLQPNSQLMVQGVPPVPLELVRDVERYTEFRGHSFVDWHPRQREMLVSHRMPGASVSQIFRLRHPLAPLEPISEGQEPVRFARYEPLEAK